MERVAPADPPHGQPATPPSTVHPDRLQRVRAARRVKPASGAEQRAHEHPVAGDRPDQQPCRQRPPRLRHPCGVPPLVHTAPPCRRSSDRTTRPSSAAKSTWLAVAAGGLARNTRRLPAGSDCRYPTAWCRSRRLTRLRTTAGPTARLTVKPILGGSVTPSRTSRCPTSSGRPTLLPEAIAALNSVRRRIRAADGSIGYHRRADDGSADQTLTRARPLRRRAASTARPARVRMRSRKPCVFARRRLFGWNVRLLTETPDAGKSPQAAANARLPPQHKVSVRCTPPEARAPGTPIARTRDALQGGRHDLTAGARHASSPRRARGAEMSVSTCS